MKAKLKLGKLRVDNLPHQPKRWWVWEQGPHGVLFEGGWHAISEGFDSKADAHEALKKLLSPKSGSKKKAS